MGLSLQGKKNPGGGPLCLWEFGVESKSESRERGRASQLQMGKILVKEPIRDAQSFHFPFKK